MPKQKKNVSTDSELSKIIDKDMESMAQINQDKVEQEPWLEEDNYEGQLSVDVYQNGNSIVIKSAIAGVKSDDIDLAHIKGFCTTIEQILQIYGAMSLEEIQKIKEPILGSMNLNRANQYKEVDIDTPTIFNRGGRYENNRDND